MSKTALLLIDIQNDYFSEGKFPLDGMGAVAGNAVKLLSAFRKKKLSIIHVRHENPTEEAPFFTLNSEGAHIHPTAAPQDDEPVVKKQHANSFKETNLKNILDDKGVDTIIIAGAMSNMCIDAVTRAASDFGYNCAVAHDACAAMALEFDGVQLSPEQVHTAFMAALGFGYANISDTETIINAL